MNEDDAKTPASEALTTAMDFVDCMTTFHESLRAYRVLLVEEGYSETAQEAMILDCHYMMVRGIMMNNLKPNND